MIGAHIRGIGVDAVAIARMDRGRLGEYALGRLFHPLEVEQVNQLKVGAEAFLASRFAAKEALVKALGTGFRGVAPREIAVVPDDLGKPEFRLDPQVLVRLGIQKTRLHLALTHEGDLALAFVVLEDVDGPV